MFKRTHYIALAFCGLLLLVLLNLPSGASSRLKLAVGGIFLPLFGLSTAGESFVDRASYQLLPRQTLISELRRLEAENARLATALKSLEARHARLSERSARAAARIDTTIARVDDLFAR